MDFLGIGPLELVFVLIIALIIFGPNDIVRAARTLGKFMRNVVTSDGWKAFQQAQKGMKDLPTTLMREAGMEDEDLLEMTGMKNLRETTQDFENQISPWTTPPAKPRPEVQTSPASEAAQSGEEEETSPEPPSPSPGSPFSQTIDDDQ
jgi:Sec-independent protein translocase protein TatA